MALNSLNRYYNLQVKFWYEDNVRSTFPFYLIFMAIIVVSIMIAHVGKEENSKRIECDEEYYVVGKSVYYPKNDIHNGISCYVISKDKLTPADKKSVYKYGLIPVDSVSGTYQKGDTIHLNYTNSNIQSLINQNTEKKVLTICFFLILIGVASYMIVSVFK